MNKRIFFCFVCLILILSISCSEGEITALGKNLRKLGNNVIGSKKDYTQENTELSESVDSVIIILTSQEPSGGSSQSEDPVEGLIDSIKAFSNAPVVDSNPEKTDNYEYEKRVDLSAEVSFKDDTEKSKVKASLKTQLGTKKQVSKGLLAESAEPDMSKYTVYEVMESARTQLDKFIISYQDSQDSAVKKAVVLANLCMTNAEKAVDKAANALGDDGKLTYEDIVVMTLANSVKNEFGKYAVDTSYRGRDIISALGEATEYLDTLKILGIIPKFNEASLLLELSEYFNTVK